MLSHRFQTIFVHIPKTAGQSVERVFLEKHGLTWETRSELLLRENEDRSLGPQRLAHLYAREYIERGYVTKDEYAKYFSFGIVRNPYERAISAYRYRVPDGGISMVDFLRGAPADDYDDRARHLEPQVSYLCNTDGALMVNEIIRFEHMVEAIGRVFYRLFGANAELPHTNRSSARLLTVEDLPAGAANEIYKRFEADFDIFAYPRTSIGNRDA